jgi:dolichol-phosphate mannosyltransferase
MTKISAVIACYRDEPAVPYMHERLTQTFQKIGVDYEIIFVNDASPDNAKAVLAELAARDPKVVVINHARNFGGQEAFTSGMQVATGGAVVLLDGDLQDPPEMIEQFYAKWREGYEVVYAIRQQREASLLMQLAFKAFYRVYRSMSYIRVPVDAGDFGLMDRKVVDIINALPETNRFLRGLRSWVGFKQIGVPYHRPERMFGRSNQNALKYLGWARRAIISFSYKPIDAIAVLAFVIVGFAFLYGVFQLGLRIFRPDLVPTGFTFLILLILFLGGIQLLCLSVIGWYLAHIYEEVKHRPPFVIESILNDPRKSNK